VLLKATAYLQEPLGRESAVNVSSREGMADADAAHTTNRV
jgi:hypothetical protein